MEIIQKFIRGKLEILYKTDYVSRKKKSTAHYASSFFVDPLAKIAPIIKDLDQVKKKKP